MFAIIEVSEPESVIAQYDDGSSAGQAAASLNCEARDVGNGKRYRVIKVSSAATNNEWQSREARRFGLGEYKKSPWHAESWYHNHHFCHVSKDDPSKVAFTPSAEHGVADRQIRMRPGRYLTAHYGSVLGADQIKKWCAIYAEQNEETPLKFASEPDDIQWVYENGPSSCMSKAPSHYNSSCHPVRVYGAGDLAIAYVKRDDRVTARALCWPKKKIYGRIYGDDNLLTELLTNAGFDEGDKCSQWEGARLLLIEGAGGIVAPYFDDPNYTVDEDGEFLRIAAGGDIECRTTDGLARQEPEYHCDRCEEGCDHTFTVGNREWCEHCYDNYSSRCEDCEECYEDGEGIVDFQGRSICNDCARNYTCCHECSEHVPDDEATYSEVTNRRYCNSCAEDMARTHCGELANDEDDCSCSECEEARERIEDENDVTETDDAAAPAIDTSSV